MIIMTKRQLAGQTNRRLTARYTNKHIDHNTNTNLQHDKLKHTHYVDSITPLMKTSHSPAMGRFPTFPGRPRRPDDFLRLYDVHTEGVECTLDGDIAPKLLHEGRPLDGINVQAQCRQQGLEQDLEGKDM